MNIPRIGEYLVGQGGKFGGIMKSRDSSGDYCLIVGPGIANTGSNGHLSWDDCKKATEHLKIDGHSDFTLPTLSELAVIYWNFLKTVSEHQFLLEWYWSSEHTDHRSAYTYAFHLGTGHHNNWNRRVYWCNGLAVRRVPTNLFYKTCI